MRQCIRFAVLAVGVLTAILAVGFAFRLSWATPLWGWPDSRLSFIFLGSIAAAIAAPTLWFGLSDELGGVPGGALNIATIGTASGIYLLRLYARRHDGQLLVTALVVLAIAAASAGLYFYCRTIPIRDRRPTPLPVRASFGLFALALIFASLALMRHTAHIFPWPLRDDTAVMIGCIFLGNAVYFIYGLSERPWGESAGQLIAFLAYDLVLIGPFLRHINHVLPAHRLSLTLYIVVLIYSGALALFYLLIAPETRLWGTPPGGIGNTNVRPA